MGGYPGASMLDDFLTLGQPSYTWTVLLDLDDIMDKLKMVQFLVHHQLLLKLKSQNLEMLKTLSYGNSTKKM